MAQEKVRIAIVGGGRTGTPMLEDFLKRAFIEVVGLADTDLASRGAALARENGIPVYKTADELAAKAADIDVIVEVSGDPAVKPALKTAFVAQGNRTTVIVHDIVARIMLSMVENSDTLIETYHPGDLGVG